VNVKSFFFNSDFLADELLSVFRLLNPHISRVISSSEVRIMQRLSRLLLVVVGILALSASASAQQRFLGSIALVPYNFAPYGTELCNGQLLPISQYTALFSLLGTYYGGDGVHDFALPDLRGRVAIGMGQGPGLAPYNMGDTGGEETVTLTLNQIPVHTHNALGATSSGTTASPAGGYWAPRPRTLLFSAASNLAPMAGAALAPAGNNESHDNLKPYLTLNYVIWMVGIFPSRN
jgi:microcystin-dependent protein